MHTWVEYYAAIKIIALKKKKGMYIEKVDVSCLYMFIYLFDDLKMCVCVCMMSQ